MKSPLGVLAFGILAVWSPVMAEENPFVGRWALTLPDGRPGWLGVRQKAGALEASILWGSGSVLPVEEVAIEGNRLRMRRKIPRKDDGSRQAITVTREGNEVRLTSVMIDGRGKEAAPETLTGRLIPELPPRPNLAKLAFATPMALLAGDLASIWVPVDPKAPNGWTLAEGVLSNRVTKKGPRWANIRTRAVYEDFMLTTEVRTLPGVARST